MKTTRIRKEKKRSPGWELCLYVADTTPRSLLAAGNLRNFCEHYLAGQYHLTIVDILKHPALARQHDILATPTLVRLNPGPPKTLIGTLSDADKVFRALALDKEPEAFPSLLSDSTPQAGCA